MLVIIRKVVLIYIGNFVKYFVKYYFSANNFEMYEQCRQNKLWSAKFFLLILIPYIFTYLNTIIHKYLVGPYSSGIPKLLSNFEIPCSLNGRESNREPRKYWYELWILELKDFSPTLCRLYKNNWRIGIIIHVFYIL